MSFDETLISVHGAVIMGNESYTSCTNISGWTRFQGRECCLSERRSGEKVMKTLFFFLQADAVNVGQEDPTVWIGYMCMIAISFSHSRTTFLREIFPEFLFAESSCGQPSISSQMTRIVI